MVHRRRVRGGHPGVAATERQIQKAQRLLSRRERGENLTFRNIASRVGFRSHATVFAIDNMDMSPAARLKRRKQKGPHRYASEADELVLAGWVVHRHQKKLDTTTSSFVQFASHLMSTPPKAYWVSRFAKRQHLSWRLSRGASSRVLDYDRAFARGEQFLRDVQDLHMAPSKIVCVDKITFHQVNPRIKSLAPQGR